MRRFFRKLLRPEWRYLLTLVVLLVAMILIFATVFSMTEKQATFWDGLWTAYITLTTIGYGDFSATTPVSRTVTVLTSMFGIGCFGVFTGVILEKALERRTRKMRGEGDYTGEGHLVLFNIPAYGEIRELLRELDSNPDLADIPRVLVADRLPSGEREIPEAIWNQLNGFVRGLPSALETLRRANIEKARACLFLSSTQFPAWDDTNTLTAALIERNWPEVVTIMACSRPETLKSLDLFKIDGGVNATELQMGLLVQELESRGVFKVFSQLSSNAGGSQIYISRTQVKQWNPETLALSIGDLKRALLELDQTPIILGIQREGETDLRLSPPNRMELLPTDRIVYIAEKRFDWMKWGPRILVHAGAPEPS